MASLKRVFRRWVPRCRRGLVFPSYRLSTGTGQVLLTSRSGIHISCAPIHGMAKMICDRMQLRGGMIDDGQDRVAGKMRWICAL